jgi:Ca2+-binding EF-hand superfamily protein
MHDEKLNVEKFIVELIVNSIKLGRESEIMKQFICENEEFEPYAVFTRFDRFKKGFLEFSDFVNFLKDSGYNFLKNSKEMKGLSLLLEYYDSDVDGLLNFEEFLKFILTKDHTLIRSISTQKKTYKTNYNQFLNEELEMEICKLILNEAKLFSLMNAKKLEITLTEEFEEDLLCIWKCLDKDDNGFISKEDIDAFLRTHMIILYEEEIKSFIYMFDEDNDGKINWNDFLFMILPMKSTFNYDYSKLRQVENEYNNIYYESIRRETLKKINDMGGVNENETILRKSGSLIQNDQNDPNSPRSEYENIEVPAENNPNNSQIAIFAKELFKLVKIEKDIEAIKVELAYQKNFDLISAFKFYDRMNNDCISKNDFKIGLEYFQVYLNDYELNLMFDSWDKAKNGKIK